MLIFSIVFVFCLSSMSYAAIPVDASNGARSGAAKAFDSYSVNQNSNPASLRSQGMGQISLGMVDLASTRALSAGWSFSPIRETSASVSLQRMPLDSLNNMEFGLGAAVHPLASVSAGASGVLQNSAEGTAIDLDLGLLFSFTRRFSFGLNARQLTENLHATSLHSDTLRHLGAGLGYSFDVQKRFSVFYDFDMSRTHFKKSKHSLGLEAKLGSMENLQFLVAGHVEDFDDVMVSLSGGIKMQQLLRSVMLYVEYGMSNLVLKSPAGLEENDPVHSVAIGISLGAKRDQKAPYVSAHTDRSLFSPQSRESLPSFMHFIIQTTEESSHYREWHLLIYTADENLDAKDPVKRFTGKGMPPKTIRWAGEASGDGLVDKGFYAYRVLVIDAQGNVGKTRWQHLEIR